MTRDARKDLRKEPSGAGCHVATPEDQATAARWRRGVFMFYATITLLLILAASWQWIWMQSGN
jgi:hypothetical protein